MRWKLWIATLHCRRAVPITRKIAHRRYSVRLFHWRPMRLSAADRSTELTPQTARARTNYKKRSSATPAIHVLRSASLIYSVFTYATRHIFVKLLFFRDHHLRIVIIVVAIAPTVYYGRGVAVRYTGRTRCANFESIHNFPLSSFSRNVFYCY